MDYPHKYFEDEVREGFYITGEIKRAWAAQIEVLSEVDKICRRHNIKWYADCGTLLGTVRHKGYIPWDDDLDICMLRDDYFKFIDFAQKELPEGFACLTLKDKEPFYQYLVRVTNGRRFNYDEKFLERFYECYYPIGVDIFPLDYVAVDEEAENERKAAAFDIFAISDSFDEESRDDEELKELIRSVEEVCNVKIDSSRPIRQQLYMASETLFTIFGSKGAKEVVLMPYWLKDNNHKYPIECFRETIMMPFENTELPVPVEYDKVLRIEYGDYMKLSKAGGVHNYPFFEQLEDILIEKVDTYYFRYTFKPDDLENEERKTGDYTKKQVINYINMTKEAHGAIVITAAQGDIETSCNLLVACQESTINIGELLEKTYGEGFGAVSVLEEYCESVYQLYQALLNGEFGSSDAEGIALFLDDIYNKMKDILEKDVVNKKEMVFIPYRADYWKSMEPMWKKAVDEDVYDVYVVPVPYYKKTARSELSDMYFEGGEYPEYVNVTDYNTYDFARRHPDVIVTMNPFDECNYTISLSREHYSKILKKYTEKLIYISPYTVDEIGLDKESKAWKTLDYFCAVPGVVRADRVLVQSEQMRESYIERLTDMSGEEYRNIWEEKVGVLEKDVDNPEYFEDEEDKPFDKAEAISNLPESWRKIITKPDGTFKKIVLYNTGIAYMAQYGEKVIDKISNSLDVFKESKDDITLIWYANPHLMRTLKKVDLRLRDKYNKVVEKYKSEAWGIFDDSHDYSDIVNLCDAYYGDPGNIPHVFRDMKKPAMIQAIDILN